jgi:hypothetical protein
MESGDVTNKQMRVEEKEGDEENWKFHAELGIGATHGACHR